LSVEQRPGKKGKVPVPVIRLSKSAGDSAPAEQPEGVAPSGGRVESLGSDGGSGPGDSPAPDVAMAAGDLLAIADLMVPQPTINEPQRRRLMAKAREHNVSTEDAKLLIKDLAGVESSKDIPADKYDTVIYAIEHWDTPAQLVPETPRREP
jgi:hypothetical protein